ncbi:MAG: tRNA (cytidine(34)-2'-O)-methyltransferase [bacterium]|nr:tRNA (cytidine(34)-2'-O)-methyltransferase [bacterium]
MLDLVLVEPEIPPNTGNVARLSVALEARLHLIEPLGFRIDERSVRRAGIDYWDRVKLAVHADFETFIDRVAPRRLLYLSAHAETLHTAIAYEPGDALVFGKETAGLDPTLGERHPGQWVRIPHWGPMRSLNLSNAVAVVAYEAMRQLEQRGLVPPPVARLPDLPLREG